MALGTFSGGGLGMGVAFVLEDYFTNTASAIERSMGQLGTYTEEMSNRIDRSLNTIKMGAAAVAVGLGLLAPLMKAIDVRADFQSYEVQFETLLKSADKAREAIDKIKQDAVDSPVFGTKALVGANASLISNGIEAERSRGLVNDLANSLAAVGRGDEELSRMGVNLQGIASTGKAAAMDIKQFAIAGLPIYAMLADSTGKTKEELQEMDITLEVLEESFRKATAEGGRFAGASERAAQSTKGLRAALSDGIELTLERIGFALEPLTRGAYANLGALLTRLREFASTPFGQAFIRFIAILGVFLVVGGTALVLIGGMRFGVYKMANAFGANTKAIIINTIATKGLSAGLREMGKAAWASLGPYILIAAAIAAFIYIAKEAWAMITEGNETMVRWGSVMLMLLGPLGWIVALTANLYRGFKELNDWKGDQGGVIGFFMRLAAIIEAVGEIWSSFSGETFALSDELAAKLEEMGLLDFVIQLGTWIVRVKMFFMGFFEAIGAGWDRITAVISGFWERIQAPFERIKTALSEIWDRISTAFAPVIAVFTTLINFLNIGKGHLVTWGSVGSFVGEQIMNYFEGLVTAITWVIEGLAWLIAIILEVAVAAWDMWVAFKDGIEGIGIWISQLIDLFFGLVDMAYNVGVAFMNSIWEGLKAVWNDVWAWLSETVAKAVSILSDPLGAAKDGLSAAWDWATGNDDDNSPAPAPVPVGGPTGTPDNSHHFQSSKSPTVINNTTNSNGGGGQSPIIMNNYLDGELISQSVIDKQELKQARS